MKDIYSVIKKPLFTEKSMQLKETHNKIVFQVNPDANKHEIKKAVEEIFQVKVDNVRTVSTKGKIKRFGRSIGKRPDTKKAIVTLKKGQKLDLIEGI